MSAIFIRRQDYLTKAKAFEMSITLLKPTLFLSILGCGLTAGILFAFSAFVMTALARLDAPQGIAAMQSINVVIINPWFLSVFLGSALLCGLLAGITLFNLQQAGASWRILGAVLFIFGVIGVSAAFNIPLNNALAEVDSNSLEGAELWAKYLQIWTRWNHVRTGAAVVALVSLLTAFQA